MKVFTPRTVDRREVTLSLQRGDAVVHRLLRSDEPYLLTEAAAIRVDERIRQGTMSGSLEPAESRPMTKKSQRVLVFFGGEPGDAVTTQPVFSYHMQHRDKLPQQFGIVPAHADWSLLPFCGYPVFDYPITLKQADCFDAWVEFEPRESDTLDMVDAFSQAVGIKAEEPMWKVPIPALQEATSWMLADTGRPRIGVVIYAGSHYRSWQAAHACIVMAGLVEAGFDCYMIGDGSRRLRFKQGDEEQHLWGDGMYDAHGLLPTMEEKVAFLANMNLVIAPDCGLLQVACSLQLPTLGLFGPTRGEARSKYAPTLKWMNSEKDCSPCWCAGDRPPCEAGWCEAITDIEPEDIVETAKTMFEENHDV